MGQYPETAIFRRFAALNSQNLLYLQAELVHLEMRLRGLEVAASQAQNGNSRLYAKDWYWLKASAEDGQGELWEAVLETKAKLKEYSTLSMFLKSRNFLTNRRRRSPSAGSSFSTAGTKCLQSQSSMALA